ncbi:MAG: NAD(P)/FAD-dependent oxidoreductase, partial [Actinomycetota bacterium]
DLHETASGLGTDGDRYRRMVSSSVDNADSLMSQVLGPMQVVPTNPLTLGRFGAPGLLPASIGAKRFRTEEARALYAGLAAHAIAPFSAALTGAVFQTFAVAAHAFGWPAVRGGSQRIAEQMAGMIEHGGGAIETGRMVRSVGELPEASIVLLDVMPPAALRIGGNRVEAGARRRLEGWSNGPGVFKVDWALDAPIPWTDDASRKAGTVHIGGSFEEIDASETAVHRGDHSETPFVIVAQQSLFDPSRAPDGRHTAWAYCHVPARSTVDMTEAIESQIERFAPGFRETILERRTRDSAEFEEDNPNYVGGDFAGGAFKASRVLRFGSTRPYRIGQGLYLCSSATPPGAGVHGMCGYHAARAAIADTD